MTYTQILVTLENVNIPIYVKTDKPSTRTEQSTSTGIEEKPVPIITYEPFVAKSENQIVFPDNVIIEDKHYIKKLISELWDFEHNEYLVFPNTILTKGFSFNSNNKLIIIKEFVTLTDSQNKNIQYVIYEKENQIYINPTMIFIYEYFTDITNILATEPELSIRKNITIDFNADEYFLLPIKTNCIIKDIKSSENIKFFLGSDNEIYFKINEVGTYFLQIYAMMPNSYKHISSIVKIEAI